MTAKTDAELLDELRAIHLRRIRAHGDGPNADAEATTREDLRVIREAYGRLDDLAQMVVTLESDLQREFAKGLRCGVCGMTSAQSKAQGYDCIREC